MTFPQLLNYHPPFSIPEIQTSKNINYLINILPVFISEEILLCYIEENVDSACHALLNLNLFGNGVEKGQNLNTMHQALTSRLAFNPFVNFKSLRLH